MAIEPLCGKTSDFLRTVLPACASGKLAAIRAYLKDPRPFVQWIGPHGRTMVWEASRKGRLSIVKLLAEEHQADLDAPGCYFRETRIEVSPWLVAKLNGKDETSAYLESQGSGLDFRSACYLGDCDYVRNHLKKHAEAAKEPYVREHRWNGYRAWPLQYAIVGRQPEVLSILLDAGADPAAHPNILYDAIDTDQPRMAEPLLKGGADPKLTEHRAWFEDPSWNELARRYGHEIREIDVPPLKWPEIVDACRGNHNAPDDPKRVLRLIKRGDDVNVRDYKGKTALHRASQAGHGAITELLLKHGSNLEARSHEGETPLFDAAFYGRTDQIRLLVAKGAEIEARNNREETPVFAAVRGGRATSLEVLHELGASMDPVNIQGKSAQDVAERSRKIGIQEVRAFLGQIAKG